MPQGSVLGQLLYVLFTAEIPQIIQSSGLSAHHYADDVQAYVHCRAAGSVDAMDRLQTVLDDLHRWMQSNWLKLNPDKTQFIWLGNRYLLQKMDHQLLSARFPGVVFQDSVIDLGATLDQELTMSTHVGNTRYAVSSGTVLWVLVQQHSNMLLRSRSRHPETQFHCSFFCCLKTEDML